MELKSRFCFPYVGDSILLKRITVFLKPKRNYYQASQNNCWRKNDDSKHLPHQHVGTAAHDGRNRRKAEWYGEPPPPWPPKPRVTNNNTTLFRLVNTAGLKSALAVACLLAGCLLIHKTPRHTYIYLGTDHRPGGSKHTPRKL